MGWKETCVMEERMKFVSGYLEDGESVATLCRLFGISRKTGHKLLKRYKSYGINGLKDRSRAPHSHPNETNLESIRMLLHLRQAHPSWGPRKLLAWIRPRYPRLALPAISTAGDILKRHDMVKSRKRKKRCSPYTEPFIKCKSPNHVWCADFKGWFRTGDGRRCDPLTISDAYSRYLLRCRGLPATRFEGVKPVFEGVFREYGLPIAIRTDNGSPFASLAVAGLSRLSVWFIKLGIRPERIEPGHPEQNGRHERMHKTLKQDTAKPPRATFVAQQKAFVRFRQIYNHERPHEALNDKTPADIYKPSNRSYPKKLSEMEYPTQMKVRRVRSTGEFKWKGELIYLSEALIGELIGLEQISDRYWQINFGHVNLAVVDDWAGKLTRK